jgi:hypothetical protein
MIVNNLDLNRAAANGIISAAQAQELRKFAEREAEASDGPIDFTQDIRDEPFRLLRGFRDAFVAIGVVIFAIGLTAVSFKITGSLGAILSDHGAITSLSVWSIFVSVLLCAFGLVMAEIITRRLRLPLSSVFVSLACAIWSAFLFTAITVLYFDLTLQNGTPAARISIASVGWFAAAGAVLGTIIFYWRYRFPFSLFLLAGSCVGLSILILNSLTDGTGFKSYGRWLIGLWGIIIFAGAMWFDVKDRLRVSRLSECAFWLHLFAAPLLVHALLLGGSYDVSGVYFILGVMTFLTIIALLIDRRALLVSGLTYFTAALLQLVSSSDIFLDQNFSITAFLLGAIVLGLGLGWVRIRSGLLSLVSSDRLKALLPPPALSTNESQ